MQVTRNQAKEDELFLLGIEMDLALRKASQDKIRARRKAIASLQEIVNQMNKRKMETRRRKREKRRLKERALSFRFVRLNTKNQKNRN